MKTAYREWIGKRLKELRGKIGLSQSELAQLLGMRKRAYGKYEEFKAAPSIYTLKRVCIIFGITIDEFMNGSPNEPITIG